MEDQTAAGAPPVPATPAQKPVKVNRLTYHGTTGGIYGVWIKQFLLSIVTLWIYHFWGKTNLRRYMIGAVELDGDRFEYHGTGKELLLGALKILPFYFGFGIIIGVIQYVTHIDQNIISLIIFPLFMYLVPVAMYSGFRYRVNRISWRGIRGRMGGSALAFGGYYLKGMFKTLFTLGIMSPSVDLGRWEYKVKNMSYGTTPFRFKGNPANLSAVNITTLLLAIPTLGFARLWYHAALQRECMRGLSLGHIRFRATMTGTDYLLFILGNLAIIIFTLGLGMPLVLARRTNIYARFIAVGGELSTLQTSQVAEGAAGDAEGLQSLMDIDVGFIGT